MRKQAAVTLVILLAGGMAFGLEQGGRSPRSFWKTATSLFGGGKSQPGKRPVPTDSVNKAAQSFDFEKESCQEFIDRTGQVCPVHSTKCTDGAIRKYSYCSC